MSILIDSLLRAMLTITSPAFGAGGDIPPKFSCEGEGISPALHIAELPANTKSLALIVHDPDAPKEGGVTHWIVWNLPPLPEIPEGFKPGADKGVEGNNSHGQKGYMGPCPPTGTHHYHFKVYALDALLVVDPHIDRKGLESTMEGHILAQGDLIGMYQKTKK